MEFARWMDHSFPENPHVIYSTSLEPGSKIVRVHHLSFRTDYGMPGYVEPEDGEVLLQLILTEGFFVADWKSGSDV